MRQVSLIISVMMISMLVLSACAPHEVIDDSVPEKSAAITDAWQDADARLSPAVRQLVGQADMMMRQGDLETAESILNRALRIDNRAAGLWSRLAWLTASRQQHRRTRDYVHKSNSLSDDADLLYFNWQLYLDASRSLADDSGVRLAEDALRSIQ